MDNFVSRLRSSYGGRAAFVTVFQDGTEVPWNTLSIGDYVKYLREQDEETEDKIFNTCVTDGYLKSKVAVMKAGVVSTVVANILATSAPSAIEDYQTVLDYYRYVVRDNLIDQMIILICQAFPAYTPLHIQGMKFDDFMYHVALAEKKLLDIGVLTTPLTITAPENVNKSKEPTKKADTRNLREEWERQQGHTAPVRTPPPQVSTLPVQPPPIPEWNGEQTVITARDIQEHATVTRLSDGHQAAEMDILVHDMLEETVGVYDDYVNLMKNGVKITPDKIKTVEERREEALERAKRNELEYNEKARKAQMEQASEDNKLETLFRKHLPVRKHKRR